jgi:hypothetical protein
VRYERRCGIVHANTDADQQLIAGERLRPRASGSRDAVGSLLVFEPRIADSVDELQVAR